ncbi:MAG TPA: SAM-dependent methyltransferase, partial [Actinomycetota bacterium]|nr:SAM-dependent methyltransferase [Actinomycetota bacterium]
MSRRRLDEEMVARGISPDLDAARTAIADRTVSVSGSIALKPETLVTKAEPILFETKPRFVSRGGIKLEGALKDLRFDASGIRCLDAGAGSGGFTDCLLQNGAEEVVAVDV